LFWADVGEAYVTALFADIDDLTGWPCVAPGGAPYQVPPRYKALIDKSKSKPKDLAFLISEAITKACSVPDVGSIVLVYLNHGNDEELGTGKKKLSVGAFVNWAQQCAGLDRRLLVVLDACMSTRFARRVMDKLRDRLKSDGREEFYRKVTELVGFITSGRRHCQRSVPLISADKDLVNLFGPGHSGE
jgi:hypothetical protein